MNPIILDKGDDQIMDDMVEKRLKRLIEVCDFSADSLGKDALHVKLRQKLLQEKGPGKNELSDELLDMVAGGITAQHVHESHKKKEE